MSENHFFDSNQHLLPMTDIRQHVPLYVDTSLVSGRGVYCREDLRSGQLIEVAPVIRLPAKDIEHIHATTLHDYYFIWGKEDKQVGIVLGYGSLYNHDPSPTAEYVPDFERDILTFYTLKAIPANTEITVNYNGTPSVVKKLWFES